VLIDLSRGIEKPAKLQISTFYEGQLADSARSDLASESSSKRQSNYINYIVRYYPGAKTSAPISIIDDPASNTIEVREFYEVDQPFTKNSRGRLELFLHGDELYKYLNTVDSSVRKSPLALTYPFRIQQTVRALLPHTWPVHESTVKVSNPAFRYESKVSYSERGSSPQITLTYLYQALSDSVDPAALPRYLADRKRAYDDVGFSLTTAAVSSAPPSSRPIAQIPLWVAGLSFLSALWIACRFMQRWDPRPAQSMAGWPVGISGWLALPAVFAVLSPVYMTTLVIRELQMLDVDHWSGASALSPSLKLIQLLIIAAGALLTVGQGLVAYLFFRRRSSAPLLFIVGLWTTLAYSTFVALVPLPGHLIADSNDLATVIGQVLGALLRTAALTTYLTQSKRVKATFIRRLARSATEGTALAYPQAEALPPSS
jgi:hypothetical protein